MYEVNELPLFSEFPLEKGKFIDEVNSCLYKLRYDGHVGGMHDRLAL